MFSPGGHVTQSGSSRIRPMEKAGDVSWALSDKTKAQDPTYITAVIESYVRLKLAKGKSAKEVGRKLDPLEREFPKLSQYFIDARETYSLGISRATTLGRISYAYTISLHGASATTSLERFISPPSSTAHITPYRSPGSTSSTSPRDSMSDVSVEMIGSSTRPIPLREGPVPSRRDAPPHQLGWHDRTELAQYTEDATPPPYSSEDPLRASTWMRNKWSLHERESPTARTGAESRHALPPRPSCTTTGDGTHQSSRRPLPPTPTPASPISLRGQSVTLRLSVDAETAEGWDEQQIERAIRESLVQEQEQEQLARAVCLSLEGSRVLGRSVRR